MLKIIADITLVLNNKNTLVATKGKVDLHQGVYFVVGGSLLVGQTTGFCVGFFVLEVGQLFVMFIFAFGCTPC